MQYHKLTRIFIHFFYVVMLSSCATTLSYNPAANPNVLDAMKSIREQILSQPGLKTPEYVEVTEATLKVKGVFEGLKVEGDKSLGIINFKEITEMVFHHKRDWFMVTLVSNLGSLYRYFSHNEDDAKKFMDNVYTMMQHQPDPRNPIVLQNQPILKNRNFTKEDLHYAD